jgi:hypothetical protein
MMSKKPNLMSTQDDDLGGGHKAPSADTIMAWRYRVNNQLQAHYQRGTDIKLSGGFLSEPYELNPQISEPITIADKNTIISLKGMSITAAQGAIITPASGSIQINAGPVRTGAVASGTLTTGSAASEAGLEQGHSSAIIRNDLLERLSWAIPEELREEIFGDLLELRAKRREAGDSRWQIHWMTLSQLSISMVLGLARRGWLPAIIEWLRRMAL